MLRSIIDISEEPQFPFKTLLSAEQKRFKKQSEDCFISTRFIEFVIGKFFALEAPFIIKSIEEVTINAYGVLLINNEFLLFIKEYLEIAIDLQYLSEIKDSIDTYSKQKKVRPVYVFISYENLHLNESRWLSAQSGFYLLNRREITAFISQYILNSKHWLDYKSSLIELDNSTISQNVHERFVFRQAAEGFFMRLSESLNTDDTRKADWDYNDNKELTLTIVPSNSPCRYSITIINTGLIKTYIDSFDYPESEDDHVFELTGFDWKKPEREIYERLALLQKRINESSEISDELLNA